MAASEVFQKIGGFAAEADLSVARVTDRFMADRDA